MESLELARREEAVDTLKDGSEGGPLARLEGKVLELVDLVQAEREAKREAEAEVQRLRGRVDGLKAQRLELSEQLQQGRRRSVETSKRISRLLLRIDDLMKGH